MCSLLVEAYSTALNIHPSWIRVLVNTINLTFKARFKWKSNIWECYFSPVYVILEFDIRWCKYVISCLLIQFIPVWSGDNKVVVWSKFDSVKVCQEERKCKYANKVISTGQIYSWQDLLSVVPLLGFPKREVKGWENMDWVISTEIGSPHAG